MPNRKCFQRIDWCPGPDAENEKDVAWGGKCSQCFLDKHKEIPRLLSDEIMGVWGDYDDFNDANYMLFVMKKNIEEMEGADNLGEISKELADTVICSLRMLAECGYHPEAKTLERLENRMEGNQDEIIARYKKEYRNMMDQEETEVNQVELKTEIKKEDKDE